MDNEKIKCELTYRYFGRETKEEVYLNEDYENDGKEILKIFNDEEYRRKKTYPNYSMDIREFISVKKLEGKINYCILKKRNTISMKDKVGYYDFLECKRCLRVYKRYTLETPRNLICNPELVCSKCRKIFKTKKGIEKHKIKNNCIRHQLK